MNTEREGKTYGGFLDVSNLDMKEPPKLYGNYAVFPIDEDETRDRKIELIKIGVDSLIDSVLNCDEIIPNFNTVTIFVREGMQGAGKSWYEGEEDGEQEPEPFYALTVALKCEGVE